MLPLPPISPGAAPRLMVVFVLALLMLVSLGAQPARAASDAAEAAAQQHAVLDAAVLEQMLAPIALYPDALLAQILMAATYPLDVVEAARWSRAHPELEGAEAVNAAAGDPAAGDPAAGDPAAGDPAAGGAGWDPSVQALVAFPEILARMSDHLRWTRQLGVAFLADEQRVMDTVQTLREKADSAGNLDNLEHARVYRQHQVIVIEPAQPHFIYVPYYNPMVIYGRWWRPAYPPVHWRPHHPGHSLKGGIHWSAGIRLSSSPLFFSTFDWQRRHIVVLNPRVPGHQSRRAADAYRGYYSNGYYRNPGKYGFERWRHGADYRQRVRRPAETPQGPRRYTAGSPRVEGGSHSPTGSYIRPPFRPAPTEPGRYQGDRRIERDAESQPRNRYEQHRAPDRRRSSEQPQQRSRSTDIQFRRGDPHYNPASSGAANPAGERPVSRMEPRRTVGQRNSPPQRSVQGSQQRPSYHGRPQSQQRMEPGRGVGRSSDPQRR